VTGPAEVVDYEELARMSSVWGEAGAAMARIGFHVAALASSSELLASAMFDPMGAARAEAGILRAAVGPRGLAALSAGLDVDSVLLKAVIAKEQYVDDLPWHQVAALEQWLLTLPLELTLDPTRTLRDGTRDTAALANAITGYAAPHTQTLLELFAPSLRFRLDVVQHRSLSVDPVFGVPLAPLVPGSERTGGSVSISRYAPAWGGRPASSIGSMLDRVADLEDQPAASIAVQRVVGADGVVRYVVVLSGMRSMTNTSDPEDLLGSGAAVVRTTTNYTTCVREAIDAALVPRGAPVVLVGHSEGGIVAMDLAGDPAFNGGRVRVKQVVAAGSPISSKAVAPGSGTRVLSIENVNDIVTHLDAADPPVTHQSLERLTYRFADDEHNIVASHNVSLYARRAAGMADSPNPLMIGVQAGLRPFMDGSATTTVFTMHDRLVP
jgi:pimeloyl-ACP methyl ester carboxylesterase